ncbi:ATP-binding protein [bacterium]|nr:ATP-binding protein [bacterium]
MNGQFIEQLLYEEEGPTLDFKRDQYAFAKASEEEKSELLKDILGFVNCWRRADAFILIGVDDVQGGRGIVHGITDHLQDHSLQQFVNNLTNRPVQFGYEACEIEGKKVGVIRIELQKRPIYLKRDYGKLKKGEVYVRRGSSTDPTKPADPDEIAHMGSEQIVSTKEASLAVEFAEVDRERSLGEQIEWAAEFCEVPSAMEIPKLAERSSGPIRLSGGQTFHIPDMRSFDIHDQLNPHYFHELANYVFTSRLVRKSRLVVTNTGDAPATDVRLEITVPKGAGYGILCWSDIPDAPKKRKSMLDMPALKHIRPVFQRVGAVGIEKTDHETKVEIDCGNLQPGRKVWTDEFHMAVIDSGEVKIQGHLYAANLSQPQPFTLSVNAQITRTSMTVDELTSLDEPENDDE